MRREVLGSRGRGRGGQFIARHSWASAKGQGAAAGLQSRGPIVGWDLAHLRESLLSLLVRIEWLTACRFSVYNHITVKSS